MLQNYFNAFLGFCMMIAVIVNHSVLGSGLGWTLGIIAALTFIVGIWGGAADSSEIYRQEHRHA